MDGIVAIGDESPAWQPSPDERRKANARPPFDSFAEGELAQGRLSAPLKDASLGIIRRWIGTHPEKQVLRLRLPHLLGAPSCSAQDDTAWVYGRRFIAASPGTVLFEFVGGWGCGSQDRDLKNRERGNKGTRERTDMGREPAHNRQNSATSLHSSDVALAIILPNTDKHGCMGLTPSQ